MSSAEQKIFKYKCDFFAPTFISGLRDLRRDNQFSDVVLKVQGREFRSHKLVLAANSKYFLSLFTADFTERESEEIRMPPEIDAEAMQTLFEYFYSGYFSLSQCNVESVFRATNYMRLDSLLDICLEIMEETLNSSNCVRRFEMADAIQYLSPSLDNFRKAAAAVVVEEAVKVVETTDFLNLSADLFSKILKSNNSQPEKAEALYTVILKWVRNDEENRKQFLSDLLQTLPVSGISSDFFNSKIKNEELLSRDPKSLLWVLDNAESRLPSMSATPDQPNSLLIAEGASTRKCFLLKIQNPTPLAVCDHPPISNFTAVSHKKQIYLFCGLKTENSYRLDDPEGPWVDCKFDLNLSRYHTGCAVLGDDLFIIGGRDWKTDLKLKSCIKLNLVSGQKQNLCVISARRELPGVAVYANSIYATCGWGIDASPSIERFDAREGRWSTVGKYTTDIGYCSSAIVSDYLYSCDVDDGKVARFDFRVNRSQEICSLPTSAWSKSISSVGSDLFAADCSNISKYEAGSDQWNQICSCSGMDLLWPSIVPWM